MNKNTNKIKKHIDLLETEIHELDLCNWYFGLPDFVNCIGGKYSNTDIDVEDTANILIRFMKFYRSMAPKTKFEKSFADGKLLV